MSEDEYLFKEAYKNMQEAVNILNDFKKEHIDIISGAQTAVKNAKKKLNEYASRMNIVS